jgi:hypothetical protein
MALDTRSRSTWRLETSIRSWHAAGRVIAGLRDLGAGNVPDLDLNIAGSRSHTRNKARFAGQGWTTRDIPAVPALGLLLGVYAPTLSYVRNARLGDSSNFN